MQIDWNTVSAGDIMIELRYYSQSGYVTQAPNVWRDFIGWKRGILTYAERFSSCSRGHAIEASTRVAENYPKPT